jgi:F0F1-type ATP synthase membrane subunit c/vacuolar-type H+-ATPase subunit K
MKSSVFKVVTLFLVVGLSSGLISIFVATLSKTWGWVGLGAILAAGLLVSMIIAAGLKWLSLKPSLWRSLFATLIIIVAYPLAVLVMLGSAFLYDSLYAVRFGGPDVTDGIITGLYPAAIVGAVLVSLALRVLTRKWEGQAILLLVIAGLLTVPLSEAIALLIGSRNWHLVLFPVGEALFSAVCGYWLVRASPVQEQLVSSPATAGEPYHRPA